MLRPATEPIRIVNLLNHTSGLTYGFHHIHVQDEMYRNAGYEWGAPKGHTLAQCVTDWARLPLRFDPGTRWNYSVSTDVLGRLVEVVSGQTLDKFMQERIFDPLGMKDTGFVVPTGKLDRLSTAYWTNAADGSLIFADGPANSECSQSPPFEDGAAGLVSTIDDYHAFGQMMLGKGALGNERILSRPSVELMMSDQLTPAQKAASVMGFGVFDREGWGFGGSVVTRRDQIAHSIGTYGWFGGFGTAWYADPKEEMTTILMTQASIASPQARALSLDFSTSAYQSIDD
jgi:CubicO group peptidase (beta-lactamase class C family)